MANSNGYTFYAVMEEAPTGSDQKFEILGEEKGDDTGVKFIEWKQVLLTFNRYNRNRRKWTAPHVRQSLLHPYVRDYFESKGGLPGECGHPYVTTEGQRLSMERLSNIDGNNICILIKSYEFEGDNRLWGTIQTIDDGNGPGDRLRRNILQGMVPSVSVRSLVPQKKNMDGTTDVIGPGRIICWDRVFYPSDDQAYASPENPYTITSKKVKANRRPGLESVNIEIPLSELTSHVYDRSDAVKYVLDGLDFAMENSSITQDNMFMAKTEDGPIFIPVEERIKADINDFMRNW